MHLCFLPTRIDAYSVTHSHNESVRRKRKGNTRSQVQLHESKSAIFLYFVSVRAKEEHAEGESRVPLPLPAETFPAQQLGLLSLSRTYRCSVAASKKREKRAARALLICSFFRRD